LARGLINTAAGYFEIVRVNLDAGAVAAELLAGN